MDEQLRKCKECGARKSINDFLHSKNDHVRSLCRRCRRIQRHAWQYGLTKEEAEAKVSSLDESHLLKKHGQKRCKGCGLVKCLSEFKTVHAGRDGSVRTSMSVCLVCLPAYTRDAGLRYRESNYFGHITSDIRNRAKIKSVPFNITAIYLERLFQQQNGLCAVTGLPMNFDRSEWTKRNPYMASVDRIVPDDGYVEGNVRWVLFAVNLAMCNWGEAIFDKIAVSYVSKTYHNGV